MLKPDDLLKVWAKRLSKEECRELLIHLIEYAIESEMVSFPPDALAPYWANTGEPLIDGQQIFPEEEE